MRSTSWLRPLEWIVGHFSLDMGIDLGTANTLVCVRGEGVVLHEPSVVAVRKGTNEVLLDGMAVGHEAKEMLGKTPGSIEAIRPLRNGVIADFDIAEKMLRYFIRKVHKRRYMVKPRIVISVPSCITNVERRAVINSAERAGAREVYLVEEPIAAGVGAGLPITEPVANMIVDIGGGTTEVAVMSLFGLVHAESRRVAGDQMDSAISEYLRREHNLLVGEPTSERVKVEIGSAWEMPQELELEIAGRDTITGLPRHTEIRSEEVREALSEPVRQIVATARQALEMTPPELAADLVQNGVVLCGGGARLRHIDQALEEALQLPVRVAEDPLTCVARGTAEFLDQLHLYRQVLTSGEDV